MQSMEMSKPQQIAFYGAASVVVASGVTCIAMVLSTLGLEFKDGLAILISALSELATFVAAKVALWVADKQTRDSKVEREERAHLMAAGLIDDLRGCGELVQGYMNSMELRIECRAHLLDQDDYRRTLRQTQNAERNRIQQIVRQPAFEISEEQLKALMPLPDRAAGRLHAVCKIAESLKRETASDSVWNNEPDLQHRTGC